MHSNTKYLAVSTEPAPKTRILMALDLMFARAPPCFNQAVSLLVTGRDYALLRTGHCRARASRDGLV